jgi:hypothetical protein
MEGLKPQRVGGHFSGEIEHGRSDRCLALLPTILTLDPRKRSSTALAALGRVPVASSAADRNAVVHN